MTEPQAPQNLAINLIALRAKQKISQQALSTKSGIPRSTIALLESGQSNPTLQVLLALCDALGVGLDELLATPRGEYKYIKAKDVPMVASSNKGVKQFKLLPDAILGLEIDRMEIMPMARKRGIPHLNQTKEYLVAIAGQTTVYVDGREYTLGEGDVLAFPGDKPHSYFNPGKIVSICISVVIPVGRMAQE